MAVSDNSYIVTGADMVGLANKIREKAGASGGLVFPNGWLETIEGIETGGVGNDLLEWFDSSKYDVQTITPTSNIETMTIVPKDASILDSLKFLLIIPTTQETNAQATSKKAIMRAPSETNYLIARMAFLIGLVSVSMSIFRSSWEASSDENGDISYTFIQEIGSVVSDRGITINSSDGSIQVDSRIITNTYALFHGGTPYKVLLIG